MVGSAMLAIAPSSTDIERPAKTTSIARRRCGCGRPSRARGRFMLLGASKTGGASHQKVVRFKQPQRLRGPFASLRHLSSMRGRLPCPGRAPSGRASRPVPLSGSGVVEGINLHILTVYGSWRSPLFGSKGEHGYRQENLAAFAFLDNRFRRRCRRHRLLVDCAGACQCRRRHRRGHPLSRLICPKPVLPLSAGLLSVLSAAGASLLACPQLCTSTELCATGGTVGRQHRPPIEPTGAEPLASCASLSAAAPLLSAATTLLMDVRDPRRSSPVSRLSMSRRGRRGVVVQRAWWSWGCRRLGRRIIRSDRSQP